VRALFTDSTPPAITTSTKRTTNTRNNRICFACFVAFVLIATAEGVVGRVCRGD